MASKPSKLILGGLDITPHLTKYKPYRNTMVTNEERNAKGTLLFDIVAHKVKIETEIESLPAAVARSILAAVSSYTVTCRYYDIEAGQMKTIQAYVPDPQPDYFLIAGKEWCGAFSMNIIEL